MTEDILNKLRAMQAILDKATKDIEDVYIQIEELRDKLETYDQTCADCRKDFNKRVFVMQENILKNSQTETAILLKDKTETAEKNKESFIDELKTWIYKYAGLGIMLGLAIGVSLYAFTQFEHFLEIIVQAFKSKPE